MCVACGLLLALALASPARADIAPPEQPPGSNISPAGQTQVQMRAERVVLDVRSRTSAGQTGGLSGDLAEAQVSGDFAMRNLGADERMQVRFPIGDPSGRGSGFGDYPQVRDFRASIAGKPVATTVITAPNPQGGDAPPVPWAAFDAAFPVGQDLGISVTYTITPTGYMPEARFAYVLETGAGWRDSIGSADIVVRLPYAASEENVLLGATSPGAQLAGNEVRWHWDDLEPTAKDNLFVTVLVPSVWQKILDARAAAQARPDDVDALVALANAYEAAVSYHGAIRVGGDRFVTLSEQAYERALPLQPSSATLHAGYAQLLWRHLGVQAIDDPANPAVRRILHEISAALALDPQNAQAKALFEEMQGAAGGKLVLETPTATTAPSITAEPATAAPTLAPTAAPTAAPAPSSAPAPTSAPAATAAPPAPTSPPASPPPTSPPPTPTAAQPGQGSALPLAIGIVSVLAVIIGVVGLVLRRRSQL